MGFQQTSFFPQMSQFHRSENEMPRERERRRNRPAPSTSVSREEIEDWAHRISICAAEADEYEAFTLETDLLDIRDEMLLAIEG